MGDSPPCVSNQRVDSQVVEEHGAVTLVVEQQRRRGPAALYLRLQGVEGVCVGARPLNHAQGLTLDSLLKNDEMLGISKRMEEERWQRSTQVFMNYDTDKRKSGGKR